MRESSSETAWMLPVGANSVLRMRHCVSSRPRAYPNGRAAIAREGLHAAGQDPDLPFVVGRAGLHAATQRGEADADDRGVHLAVGGQSALFGAGPEPNVGEGAEMGLRGDVASLPGELAGQTLAGSQEILLELGVADAGADVAARTGERVVLLEHGEREEPEGFLPRGSVQRGLQQLQPLRVVLRLEHEPHVVQNHRLRQLVRPQEPVEQRGGVVLTAHLGHHQHDLHALALVADGREAQEAVRPFNHALHVPQPLLGLHHPTHQRLVLRQLTQSLRQHLAALRDEPLIEVAARPVQPRERVRRVLAADFLVQTKRLRDLPALFQIVRLVHLLPRRPGLPARLAAVDRRTGWRI